MSVDETGAQRRRRRAGEPGPAAGPGSRGDRAVGLDRVNLHHWQVVDRSRPVGDPFRVLALVASVGGSFEVMQFGRGFEWRTFASLDHALAHVVVTSAAQARTRSGEGVLQTPETDDAEARRARGRLHALPRPTQDGSDVGDGGGSS